MNPAAPAPHDLIERLRRETDPFLLLLTGGRGAGKTRWCLKLLDEARAAGISAVGVLSPPVYTAGDKTAIDLLNVASGQRQRLAERPRPGEPGTAGLGWRFDPAVLDRGNAVLEKLPPGELLLIDELGPLEFRGEGGFIAGFAAIDARHYRLAVVVVRPELLDAARQRWPWYSAIAEMRMP